MKDSRVSGQTPASGDTTARIARAGEPLYTEEELALILNKAAELQGGGARPSEPRYTLAQIQEIAAGAGIASSDVVAAATGLRENRERGGTRLLGAPWRFRCEETVDGELSEEVIGELMDLARRELGLQGTISEALGAVEWTGRDALGSTHVTVTRRGGRTTIVVLSARTDAAAVSGTLGATSAVLGSLALAMVVGTAGLAVPLAMLTGVVGGTTGSWLSMRTIWRRLSRRYAARTTALSAALVETARRAVEEGRVTTR